MTVVCTACFGQDCRAHTILRDLKVRPMALDLAVEHDKEHWYWSTTAVSSFKLKRKIDGG